MWDIRNMDFTAIMVFFFFLIFARNGVGIMSGKMSRKRNIQINPIPRRYIYIYPNPAA